MADLDLTGPLDLGGVLDLVGQGGGKVTIKGVQVLVVGATASNGVPVLLPPPPAPKPIDDGTGAECVSSMSQGVTAGGTVIVTMGMVLQGNTKTWPGMLTPSSANSGPAKVTINNVPINVKDDKAAIFPNGSTTTFDKSGQ